MVKGSPSPGSSVRLSTRGHQQGHRRRPAGTGPSSTSPCRPMGPSTVPGRHEGADQQRVDGKPRRAGHERRHQDRHQAVARRRDRARRHDAGDGARVGGEQRHEGCAPRGRSCPSRGRPRRPRAPCSRRPRADREARRAARSGAGRSPPSRRRRPGRRARKSATSEWGRARVDGAGRGRDGAVDRVHGGRRPGEDQLEEGHHDDREEQRAPERVQHEAVDRLGEAVVARGAG